MSPDSWIEVVALDAIPPEGLHRFEVDGCARILARAGDAVYALDGICTHEEAELCDGEIEGFTLWCPLHSAGFDLPSGRVVAPPAERPLASYEVELRDGVVYVAREERPA